MPSFFLSTMVVGHDPNQFWWALLVLVLFLAWCYYRLSISLKALSQKLLSPGDPAYRVDLETQNTEGGWLAASIVITAVDNPSIFLGGSVRLFDRANRKLLDRQLEGLGRRNLRVGETLRIPLHIRIPAGQGARPVLYRYEGCISCSDVRGIQRHKVRFGTPGDRTSPAVLGRLAQLLVFDGFLTPAGAAVVLDGREFSLRLAAGLEVLERDYAPRLFICLSQLHRSQHAPAEEAMGQNPGRVTLVRSGAVSTLEEAAELRPHLLRLGCQSLLVVTSWYHTRRAQLIFERRLKRDGIKVSAYAVAVPCLPLQGWWTSREGRTVIALELLKLFWTRVRLALLGPPDLRFRLKEFTHPEMSRPPSPPVVEAGQAPVPAVPSHASQTGETPPVAPREYAQQPLSRRVLVIEEKSAIHSLIQELLTPLGYQTDSAKDGREALARISRENYDSILLDLRYPGADAEEVIPAIRRICPALVGRVLVITGEVTDERTLQMIDEHFLLRISGDRVSYAVPEFLRALLHLPSKP